MITKQGVVFLRIEVRGLSNFFGLPAKGISHDVFTPLTLSLPLEGLSDARKDYVMAVPLGKGVVLIATPALRDPNFRQTVILLCEHGPEGALGVVLNRPTEMNITEVLPHMPVLEGQPHRVFSGGPVQKDSLLVLYHLNEEVEDTHAVLDGIYLGGNMETLKRILEVPSEEESFRTFMGYSGWGPGQLEHEMKSGSWLIMPAKPKFVFEDHSSGLWAEVLQSFGDEYSMYAHMPIDPSLN